MPGQSKLADSNIAAYGGKDHKSAKERKAQAEKEFKGAGATVGVEIWRVVNFAVEKWPKKRYGTFYGGDSYLVLNTYKRKGSKSKKLLYNAHFWLGRASSQDEQGTAAYKVVELDDLLGDLPVQYRETQGHESKEFMAIFKGRIKILKGGAASGFTHVEEVKHPVRLLQCKGKVNVRVMEVPLETSSLNHGDTFILDLGSQAIQWNGNSASAWEKRKAAEVISELKSERGSLELQICDGEEDNDTFWSHVKGPKSAVGPATDDKEVKNTEPELFQVSDASGKLKTISVGKGKTLARKLLDPKDVFILDLGFRLFVWVGSKATKQEKKGGMEKAVQFLKQSNRPGHTPITKLHQEGELEAFDRFFTGKRAKGGSSGKCVLL